MSESPKEQAQRAVSHASDEVAEFIFAQAQERAREHHSTSLALDQRAAQTAGFLIAAAAVAGTVAMGARTNFWLAAPTGLATVAFAIGAGLAFRAVQSTAYHAPGLPPAWWKGIAEKSEFDLRDARCWAAGALQEALDENTAEDERRATHLNMALRYGLGGALIVAIGAVLRVFST